MKGLATTGSYKLAKPRTHESSIKSSMSVRSAEPARPTIPNQASFEGLTHSEARHLLRQQSTGTFQDTSYTLSQQSMTNNSMTVKDRSTRRSSTLGSGYNQSAQSSSSTVDNMPPMRLSVVPEKDSKTIDIEQAIYLLQELKKSASPNELVALHRALLPTREVESVNNPCASTFEERTTSPLLRRRSALPPGLATRGGITEDLLRKPGEPTKAYKAKLGKKDGLFRYAASAPITSIAALDLADEPAYVTDARAPTPSEISYSHTGAYRHGTLRVTNGVASPEPSMTTVRSGGDSTKEESRAENAYFTASEGRPSLEVTRGRASLDILSTQASEESFTIRDRILKSDKALHQRQQRVQRLSSSSDTPPSRDSSITRTPLPHRLQTKVSTQSSDGESVSPGSDAQTPRFQQRWSHHASQISQEYLSECELTASPYDERTEFLSLASQLSTIYDSDPGGSGTDRGTSQAALCKLTGNVENSTSSPVLNIDSERSSDEHVSASWSDSGKRPMPPEVNDSGYGSETSCRKLYHSACYEVRHARMARGESSDETLNKVNERAETALMADVQSLYNFEEVLKSPDLLNDIRSAGPEESLTMAQSVSPLPFRKTRRISLPIISGKFAQVSSDTILKRASTQSSPGDSKKPVHIIKQQRKLQKPIPKAVKEARRAEIYRERELRTAIEGRVVPQTPADTVSTHSKRASIATNDGLTQASTVVPKPQQDVREVPAKLSGGDSLAAPAPNVPDNRLSSSPARSKSRGRRRSISFHKASNRNPSDSTKAWTISRSRNRSKSRGRSQTPKRSSFSDELKASLDREGQDQVESPGTADTYADLGFVAKTLGSGAYDISTNQFKRNTAPATGAVDNQLPSPYLISTGLTRPQQTSGMDEAAASELARLKSRDVGGKDKVSTYDRPRMATPKQRGLGASSRPQVSVEGRIPDWHNKHVFSIDGSRGPRIFPRPKSMYAESIPPMPELPADVEAKASKADEMVAKKLKDSARSMPAASARNSNDAQYLRPGDAVQRAMQARHDQEAQRTEKDHKFQPFDPTDRAGAKREPEVTVEVRALSWSGSEQSSDVSVEIHGYSQQPVRSSFQQSQHPGWPGWEQQANLWRKRCETAGAALGKSIEGEVPANAETPPISREPSKSPALVVPRHITPLGADHGARPNSGGRPTDTSAQQTHIYQCMIADKENRPAKVDVPRTSSAISTKTTTSTFVTLQTADPRPPKQSVPRADSAFSAKSNQTYTTTASTVTHTRGSDGGVNTSSESFIPSSASQAAIAERSRAQALAKLTSATHSPPAPDITQHQNRSQNSLLDRYSGGLAYGWERGVGFADSAGNRQSGSSLGKRKSLALREGFGLDLSDVPVFFQEGL